MQLIALGGAENQPSPLSSSFFLSLFETKIFLHGDSLISRTILIGHFELIRSSIMGALPANSRIRHFHFVWMGSQQSWEHGCSLLHLVAEVHGTCELVFHVVGSLLDFD